MNLILPCYSIILLLLLVIVYFRKVEVKTEETKMYCVLLFLSLFNVIFNIIGIYLGYFDGESSFLRLLNHLDLPLYFWWSYCILMYLLYTYIYVIKDKKNSYFTFKYIVLVFNIICTIITVFLPFDIILTKEAGYIVGNCVNFTYIISGVYLLLSLIVSLILVKYNFKKTIPLFSLILLGVVSALIQKNVPSLIIVPSVAVFVELIMYFTIENPDIKLMNELVVAKDIAEKSKNETINTLNNITYKLNEEKNKLNNINIDKNNIEKESKKLQLFYNNLLNEINDLIELGKINSSSYKIEEELYDLEEVLDKLNDLINAQNNNVKVSYNKEYNKILYGDYKKILLLILYMINYLSNKIESSSIKLDISLIEVNNICKLKFNFSVLEKYKNNYMYYDKFTKENYLIKDNDYRIIINLLRKLEGKLIIKDNNIIISLYQKVSNNLKLSNEVNNKKVRKINSNNKKILLVDDNNKKLEIISNLLNKYNINTDTINDYDELGSTLLNNYDLILVDDIMPKINNLSNEEMLRKYSTKMIQRINGTNIPVVIMLTNNDVINSNNYFSYGYDDYILKPINDKTIKELLNKYFK
ncbi:MAG: response regulator [Bacilli bacterium]|nr:response regulator [Bacilli bacterium]